MLSFPFEPSLALLPVAIAFCSGIGITTIGPGGIFVTIALTLSSIVGALLGAQMNTSVPSY